jgi:hypothetical protein
MISHGTTRLVLCLGPYAIKIAKGERGRRCNRFEAALWKRTTEERRKMLCPILATIPFGVALMMKRAKPTSEEEKDHLISTDRFPDWARQTPHVSTWAHRVAHSVIGPFQVQAIDVL